MSALKPAATTANPTPTPVTVYNLAKVEFRKSPIHQWGGSKEKKTPPPPNGDNPTKVQQPKAAATATALQTREDTP